MKPQLQPSGPTEEISPPSPEQRQLHKTHVTATPLLSKQVLWLNTSASFCHADCKTSSLVPSKHWKLRTQRARFCDRRRSAQCPRNCAWTNGEAISVGSSDTPYTQNRCEWESLVCEGVTYTSVRRADCWDEALCEASAAHWSPRGPETLAGFKWATSSAAEWAMRVARICPSTAIKWNPSD